MSVNAPDLLVVGSNPLNQELLVEFIHKLGYTTVRSDTLESLDRLLDQPLDVVFALVDITGFDSGIWSRCARLHQMDIPLLLISPKQGTALKKLGLANGAQAILEKPVGMRELADLIRGMMQARE